MPRWHDSLLRAFPDLRDLICDSPVGFAMYRRGCFFAWSLAEAKHLAGAFIIPVPQVLDSVLVLNLKVFRVVSGDPFSGQSLHIAMSIHIEWHCYVLLLSRIVRAQV